MILDFNTQVSSAQVVTATGLSTSSCDMGAAARFGNEDLINFLVNVSSVSGTSPTLSVEIVGADDAALSTNVVSLSRQDLVVSAGMAAKNFFMRGQSLTKKRYVGLRYTVGGTTPSFTITAAVVMDVQADYQQS